MKKNYNRKRRRSTAENGYLGAMWRMLPALLMVGIVPLIVRQYAQENGLSEYAWASVSEVTYEFFLGAKSVVLLLLLLVMAGCVLARAWKEKRKLPFAKLLIPLFAYGALCFLSACVSVNHSYSFFGGYEQFESVWVLLSYVLVVYYVFLYAMSEMELQVVTDALCFGASVIGLLGTLQGVGMDYLNTTLGQRLVTTDAFLDRIGGKLTINFQDNYAYATLYNPNYLGVYASFVIPFLAVLLLYEKNKWRRLWHGVNLVLVLIALLSSRSRAGLIAAVFALAVAVILFFPKLFRWWYLTIPALNLAVALVLLVNAYNDNIIFDRLKGIFAPDIVVVGEYTAEDGTIVQKTGLTELYTTEQGVMLTYNEMSVQVAMPVENGTYGMYAIDREGNQIELVADAAGLTFSFTHPALAEVKLSPVFYGDDGTLALCISGGGNWYFYYDEGKESYQYIVVTGKSDTEPCITVYGKPSDMIMADSLGFEDYQKLFSGRGYIWSRTLPLLKDYIFLGSGPDTFLFVFPQEDYLAMSQNGYSHQIMTKPHSMYLQVGVQTGVLSLVCLLTFYVWYAVWSLRLYAFKRLDTQTEAFGIAAFIGSIAYMISGISNDSMVVTAPVFWGMIGIGVAANAMVARSRKRKEMDVVEQSVGKGKMTAIKMK